MGVSSAQSEDEQQPLVHMRAGGPVIAIFNVPLIGHMNPTFPLVMELARRGCNVHYFLPPNEDLRSAARQAGAVVESLVKGDPSDFDMEACGAEDFGDGSDRGLRELMVWPLASTLIVGDQCVTRCRELGVQTVLYNPCAPHGLIVAELLHLPRASLVTFPGVGSLADLFPSPQILEVAKAIRRPYGLKIKEKFGVDLQEERVSRFLYLSRLNLVTTSEDLITPLPPVGEAEWADEMRELYRFNPVGCMVSDEAPHVTAATRPAHEAVERSDFGRELPIDELAVAAARGTKVIYAALGTMALSTRWSQDLGTQSGGNLPAGTTGKQFCQHVWRAIFAAMKRLGDGYLCVLCIGMQHDALDFLEAAAADESRPENVVLRSSLPQVEMLQSHTRAFISHVGFNSMQESLYAGVPIIAVPQAVDQPANARKVQASGWGRSFLNPMETVTAESLESAVRDVTAAGSRFQEAVAAVKSQLQGGPVRAAEILMKMASDCHVAEQLAA